MRLEGRWAVGDEGRADLGDAVGERELEARDEELPDVGAADVLGLLDLNNAEDLSSKRQYYTLAEYWQGGDARGSTGSEHGDGQPCPGRGHGRHPHD